MVFDIAFGVFLILEKPWFEVLEFAFVDFVFDMEKNIAEVGFFGKDVSNALQLAFESDISLFGVFEEEFDFFGVEIESIEFLDEILEVGSLKLSFAFELAIL